MRKKSIYNKKLKCHRNVSFTTLFFYLLSEVFLLNLIIKILRVTNSQARLQHVGFKNHSTFPQDQEMLVLCYIGNP